MPQEGQETPVSDWWDCLKSKGCGFLIWHHSHSEAAPMKFWSTLLASPWSNPSRNLSPLNILIIFLGSVGYWQRLWILFQLFNGFMHEKMKGCTFQSDGATSETCQGVCRHQQSGLPLSLGPCKAVRHFPSLPSPSHRQNTDLELI